MADDDRLLKARNDGARAAALLNDETLQAAITELKRAYADKLLSTSIDQSAARETLYQAYRIVGEFENHLRNVLDSGKLAEAEIQHLIQLREPKKTWASV